MCEREGERREMDRPGKKRRSTKRQMENERRRGNKSKSMKHTHETQTQRNEQQPHTQNSCVGEVNLPDLLRSGSCFSFTFDFHRDRGEREKHASSSWLAGWLLMVGAQTNGRRRKKRSISPAQSLFSFLSCRRVAFLLSVLRG